MSDIFGKKIGQYILLEQLGEGGMAKVYNALDKRVERNVAIKVILPNKQSSQVFLQQFDLEAKALANLTHTNIVKVIDYGTADGQPYLVMDFVQGGTLKDAVVGALPYQKAAEILAPIARALDYVHQHNIVHQDIKPSNILLDEDFRPMLSDFGVVKMLEQKDGANAAAIGVGVGTPDYMAPEQGMGKDVDFRADIYSLGVVFYELVTGEKPFTADTPMAVVIKHVTEEFPSPLVANNNLPVIVEKAISRAVQKDPQDRYENMGQFAEVLEMITLGEKAQEKNIIALTKKRPRKVQILWPVLASLLALTILSVAIILNLTRIQNLSSEIGFGPTLTPLPTSTPQIFISNVIVPTEKIVITATPDAKISATQVVVNVVANPTSTPTELITEDPLAQLALMGTPFSTKSLLSEVGRWGIGGVNKVDWSPSGDLIALGTTSGIFIYDSATKERKQYIDAGGDIVELKFSPDGSKLASGSLDGRAKIWDVSTGKGILLELTKNSSVTSISFSRNGKNLIFGFSNGDFYMIAVDGLKTSLSKNLYPSIGDAVSSADERFLYISKGDGDSKVYVWDVSTQKQVEPIVFNAMQVNKIALSTDRQYLIASAGRNSVNLYDLVAKSPVNSFANLGGNVTEMEFSADSNLIIIALDNGFIKVFKRPEIKDFSNTQIPILTIPASKYKLQSIAMSPDQKGIAVGTLEDGLTIWDAQTASEKPVFSLDQSMLKINSMSFSPDAKWLATSHDGNTVRVWNVSEAKLAYTFEGYLPPGEPTSPDSRFLTVIKSTKNTWELGPIQVVELNSGKIVRELPGYVPKSFIQFSPDMKLIAMGTAQTTVIWDVSTWEKLASHGEPSAGCGQFYTRDNSRVAMVSSVGVMFPYLRTESELSIDTQMCGKNPNGATFVYYFQEQKRKVFVLGDGQIWVWDFENPEISRIGQPSPNRSPGDIFLGANQKSGLFAGVSGDNLYIFNIRNLSYPLFNNLNAYSANKLIIQGQLDYDYQVAFLPDLKIFALGSRYGSIHIWSLP